MPMTDLKAQLQAELTELLKQDNKFRQWLEQLIRQTAVTPESFDAHFERMLQEFAADRAKQRRKCDEHDREWEERSAKFDAHAEEQRRKWDEQNRKWDEQNRKTTNCWRKSSSPAHARIRASARWARAGASRPNTVSAPR